MAGIKEIFSVEEWNMIKRNSNCEIIIFKYSPICPISSSVEKDFDSWISEQPDENIKCVKVNVIDSKPLSRQLADELGVFHQSPQVIWLTDKHKAKWNASHYDITSKNLWGKINP